MVDPQVPATVIDRPSHEGDHLFVTDHQGHQVLGAVDPGWQRDPARRTQHGLVAAWWNDPRCDGGQGDLLRASVEISRDPVRLEDVEYYVVQERPAFVVPDGLVGDEKTLGDEQVARLRAWYQAAWTVAALTGFIREGAAVLEGLRRSGRGGSVDCQEVELELSTARIQVMKARATLRTTDRA